MTKRQVQALRRIAAGFVPYTGQANNPASRDSMKRLERDGFVNWSPKGWTLTERGKAAIL